MIHDDATLLDKERKRGLWTKMIELDRIMGVQIAPFFGYTHFTVVRSFLDGCMGRGWVDDGRHPTCALVVVGELMFLAGDISTATAARLVANLSQYTDKLEVAVVPQDEAWAARIESLYPGRVQRVTRYALKHMERFPEERLRTYIDSLPEQYRLLRIEEKLYHRCLETPMKDLCSQFSSAEEYLRLGLGYCILDGERIVCGASSFTTYGEGIEIEVDTDEAYRRQGLATICSARLILECLSQGRYPSWDAANLESVALAKKLGYEFSHEYDVWTVDLKPGAGNS